MKWKAILILIIALSLTLAITFHTRYHVNKTAQEEFETNCTEIERKISARLHAHALILRAGSAYFSVSDTVTREDWKIFIERSKIEKNLPGILGVGFSLLIPADQLNNHIRRIRKEGFPDYSVYPAGKRSIYTSIIYLEPFSGRNLKAFGYDMFSEPLKRKTMELSRDHDLAMLSGKIDLVQETKDDIQSGTLMYVPFYKSGMPVNTTEQRRAAILGWVYSPCRMNDLMQGVLGHWDNSKKNRICLQVYDDSLSLASLMYDSQRCDSSKITYPHSRTNTIWIQFNGKQWVLHFSQVNGKSVSFAPLVIIVFFGGIIISVLLYLYFLSLFNTLNRSRKIAEKLTRELKESEKKYRDDFNLLHSIFESPTSIIIFAIDKEYCYTAFTKFHQKTIKTIWDADIQIGTNMLDVITGLEDRQKTKNNFDRALQGECFTVSEDYGNADLYRTYYENYYNAIKDANGNIVGVSVFVIDVSKRKHSENLVLQTRQNYEAFFNTIPEFLFVLDMQGNIIRANSTVIDRLGYTKQELTGQSVLMLHPEERRDEAGRIVGEMLAGQTEFCPIPLITKKGILIPVETRVAPGVWDGVSVIFGVTTDISQLRLSEEKFSKVFYLNPSACGLSDLNTGQYIEVNDTFYKLLEFNKDEVIGKTAMQLDILTDETRNMLLHKSDSKGKITSQEATLKTKNNSIKHVLLSAEYIYVQDKQYRFTVVHDITDLKHSKELVSRKNQELTKLNAQKDKFFSIIAHDLKSPFNSIVGFSDLLLERVRDKDYEGIGKYAAIIQSSSERAMNLLKNLMDWSRSQTGRMEFNPEFFEMNNLINETVEFFRDIARQKSIVIKQALSQNLPIFADIDMINTILRNLISNAIKYTSPGGEILISTIENQNEISVSVSDNGVGIPAGIIKKLFQIDQNISTSGTQNEQGTGLGLILCREFIEKHGGKIWVESEEGKGFVFSFVIKK